MTTEDFAGGSTMRLSEAAERLRGSARWLVASFGAIAAVAFAGVSFSSLGSLTFTTPDYRLTIALVGLAVATSAILYALARAMRLSGASTTTISDLRRPTQRDAQLMRALREARNDPGLTFWDGDVERFLDHYSDVYRRFVDEACAFADDTHPDPDRSDLDKAAYRLRVHTNLLNRLLETVSFLRLQYSFEKAMLPILISLAAAAVGAGGFAWATSGV